jgi:Bacterial SH3 domain
VNPVLPKPAMTMPSPDKVEQSSNDTLVQSTITSTQETTTTNPPNAKIVDSSDADLAVDTPLPQVEVPVVANKQFIVKTERLNVRAEASMKSAKLFELKKSEVVTIMDSIYGNEIDGWIWISARDGAVVGWVKKSFLQNAIDG